jgi:hypothetical protein
MMQIYNLDINELAPMDRINQLYKQHIYLHYSLHIRQVLVDTFSIAQNFKDEFAGYGTECLLNLISVIAGKHRVLPIFFGVSEVATRSARHIYSGIDVLRTKEEFKKDYQYLVESISIHLSEKQELSIENSTNKINLFFDKHFPEEKRVEKNPAKNKLKSIIGNLTLAKLKIVYSDTYWLIYRFIRKKTSNIFEQISQVKIAKKMEGYPFIEGRDKIEWEKILGKIKWHNKQTN